MHNLQENFVYRWTQLEDYDNDGNAMYIIRLNKCWRTKKAMDRNEFCKSITGCQCSASITHTKVNFLFGIFDKTKDGLVHIDDFHSLKYFPEKTLLL